VIPSEPWIVLIGGLSRAGKSMLAEAICAATDAAQHLPLDKYFHEVPPGQRFLDWVQRPASVDWETADEHLARLRGADDVYTPVIDWHGSGRRLSGGDLPHPGARRVLGGASCYVVPGCHALAAPWEGDRVLRIFIDTPLGVIAARCEGRQVAAQDVEDTLARHLTPRFGALLAYRDRADRVLAGAALEGDGLPAAAGALVAELGLARGSPS
jgi:uridine kinase